MKRIFYIIILIAGFHFSSQGQVNAPFSGNVALRTVKFYPNPAVSSINFEFLKDYDPSFTLQVYNFIGKKIVDLRPADRKINLSLNDFYRGVYIFQLKDRQGSIIESGKFQVVK